MYGADVPHTVEYQTDDGAAISQDRTQGRNSRIEEEMAHKLTQELQSLKMEHTKELKEIHEVRLMLAEMLEIHTRATENSIGEA